MWARARRKSQRDRDRRRARHEKAHPWAAVGADGWEAGTALVVRSDGSRPAVRAAARRRLVGVALAEQELVEVDQCVAGTTGESGQFHVVDDAAEQYEFLTLFGDEPLQHVEGVEVAAVQGEAGQRIEAECVLVRVEASIGPDTQAG